MPTSVRPEDIEIAMNHNIADAGINAYITSRLVADCCPELRWRFIRHVYAMQCLQFSLAFILTTCVKSIKPLNHFFLQTSIGLVVFVIFVLIPFALMWLIYLYRKNRAVVYLLLFLSTAAYASALAVACVREEVVAEIVFLIIVAFCNHFLYIWLRAPKIGFLRPFICSAILLVLAFGILFQTGVFQGIGSHKTIKALFVSPPNHKLLMLEIGCLIAILFSALLIFNTNLSMKCFTFEDGRVLLAAPMYLYIFVIFVFFDKNR